MKKIVALFIVALMSILVMAPSMAMSKMDIKGKEENLKAKQELLTRDGDARFERNLNIGVITLEKNLKAGKIDAGKIKIGKKIIRGREPIPVPKDPTLVTK